MTVGAACLYPARNEGTHMLTGFDHFPIQIDDMAATRDVCAEVLARMAPVTAAGART